MADGKYRGDGRGNGGDGEMELDNRQLFEVIKDMKENKRLKWEEMEEQLARMGHTSPRTRKKLKAYTIRHIYYYGRSDVRGASDHDDPQEEDRKLVKVKKVLKRKDLTPQQRLDMIGLILDD